MAGDVKLPQAWSTGAPFLLLRTMLGLAPHGDHLIVDPAVPAGVARYHLRGVNRGAGCSGSMTVWW